MNHFELQSHVDDVRMRVKSQNLPELFSQALTGMAELIKPGAAQLNATIEKQLEVTAPDETALLINFLSDVLTHSHIEKAVFCRVEFSLLSQKHAQATIYGAPVDDFDEDVKAVTFHEADIQQDEQGNYSTIVIFDI